MLEQGPDVWRWFDTTQFSDYCVHPIHAKTFSIQMLLHFSAQDLHFSAFHLEHRSWTLVCIVNVSVVNTAGVVLMSVVITVALSSCFM